MRSKRIVSASWTIGALMVLSAGDDPASAPYQRAILPLNEESMTGAGWLNQTAASALRRARSVTELNQQKVVAFSKAGDRPFLTTRHRADLSMWSASKNQAEVWGFWECRTLRSLLSACLGRGWTFADLVETAPGFGRGIPEGSFHDARQRARIRLRLQSPCGGGGIDVCYVAHGSSFSLGRGP